jgi:hypothetical protein
MGIHTNLMTVLRELAQSEGFGGALCTLGVQDMPAGINAVEFYRELGFANVETLDSSDYEGAQHIFDLNSECLPVGLAGRFDVVFNGGTLEHVFHVPNALASMTAMLKCNGIVAHLAPTNGWVDHGFYQISPTLLHDYYEAAGFEPLTSVLLSYKLEKYEEWLCRPIAPGDLGEGASGVIDRGIHLYFFAARRSAKSNLRPVPHQRVYSGKTPAKRAPSFMPYLLRNGKKATLPELARLTLSSFVPEAGNAVIASIPSLAHLGDGPDHPTRSPLILLEDGVPLRPGHSSHQTIRERGSGAFSHWQGGLYFSTSDNSDPATNGRSYVAVVPDWTGIL